MKFTRHEILTLLIGLDAVIYAPINEAAAKSAEDKLKHILENHQYKAEPNPEPKEK